MAQIIPKTSTAARASAPRTRDEYDWAIAEWESYGGDKPRPPTATERTAWAAAELVDSPRSREEYQAALDEADSYGTKKPIPPHLAAEQAQVREAASKEYAVRAESQARTPERLAKMRETLGVRNPVLRTQRELRDTVRDLNQQLGYERHYAQKPNVRTDIPVSPEARARLGQEYAVRADLTERTIRDLGLEPGQKVPLTRPITPGAVPSLGIEVSTAAMPAPAPMPEPAPAPPPAQPKPQRNVMATKRPARGPSAPRVQPDMFGAPPTPAQPFYSTRRDFMFNPGETPTLGGDFNSMYDAARGPQAVAVQGTRGMVAPAGAPAAQAYAISGQRYPVARPSYPVALDQPGMVLNRPAIGNAGPLPMVERLPDPMRTALGIDVPAARSGQGDFFGGGGAVPQGFVADPSNPGQGKFHLQPASQGALWPELDPRNQPLRRVVAGGNYTPPHDPAAYSTRPMGSAPQGPSMMSQAGDAAMRGLRYAGGLLARTAPVLDVALPGMLDHNAEVAATMRAMQSGVGGGRGNMPASAYPRGMDAVLGTTSPMPVNSRGQGFNDPRMVQGAPAPANARGQGFNDPRMIRRPAPIAPIARVVRRAPQPGPWSAMPMDPSVLMQTPVTPSGLPVGNAGIDEATRRRAYAAMGMLP